MTESTFLDLKMETNVSTQELLLTQNRSSQTKPLRPGEDGDGHKPAMIDLIMTKFFDGKFREIC